MNLLHKVASKITSMIKLIKEQNIPETIRTSAISLITNYVNTRDTICQMMKQKVESEDDFAFQMQLRFKFTDLDHIYIKKSTLPSADGAY